MADYSAFAPPPPPRAQGAAYGASTEERTGAGLAGQIGQMSIAGGQHGSYGQGYGRTSPYGYGAAGAPSPSFPPSSSNNAYPSSSAAPYAYPSAPAAGAGYSAANRPRPQLSPVATTGYNAMPSTSGPGGGAIGGSSYGSGVPPPRSMDDGGSMRVPRKSSLPPTPNSESHSSAPPPPPAIPSAHSSVASSSSAPGPSAHSSFASAQSGSTRDSSGGEAVFDGAAISAAGALGQAQAPPPQRQEQQQASRGNPLVQLIETEQQYVDDLGVVIKRVAAAWSRSNFPPPALDTMFRAVEAVYRINKTLLGKLLEIGPNPSSPKALGDLLSRWIPDLEPAYTRYATTLQLDFDSYSAVQSNPNLAPILSSLSYPLTLPRPPAGHEQVTMDRLFELPVHRVRYYQKLYAKLLRSTPDGKGKTEHALLLSANQKLARIEQLCEEGLRRSVLAPEEREEVQPEPSERREPPKLEVDLGLANGSRPAADELRSSDMSAREDSPTSSSYRSSGATGNSTANTSAATGTGSPPSGLATMDSPLPPVRVEELERRLNTERTLDIFSMQPRKCKLQMQPPTLPYRRQLRKASPCNLSFYPSCDPSRLVSHPHAFLILLTDLFLICERMSPSANSVDPAQDLWLAYPPLAGKHLAAELGQQGDLDITVMRRERLTFRFADEREAEEWKRAIEETVQFGVSPTPGSNFSSGPTSPVSGSFSQPKLSLQTALGYSPSGIPSPSSTVISPTSAQHDPSHSFSPDSRGGMGYGAPPSLRSQSSRQQLQQPYDRRAFSGPEGLSVARPERKASMGLSPSPLSANFPASPAGSRGASPCSSGSEHYGQPQQQQYQQQDFAPAPPQQGGSSTYPGIPRTQNDFAPPNAPFAQGDSGRSPSRSSSYSNGSIGSRSSGYPDPPPPLPKEMSYNGQGISGRGGPLYSTNLQGGASGGGYDSRSLGSGRSGFLSPGSSVHRSQSADGLRGAAEEQGGGFQQHYRMPSQALLEDRAQSAPGASRQGSKLSHSHGAEDDSPPASPVEPRAQDKTRIVAEMRCKIFLQQHHAVWKSLGTAKLKLFLSQPSNTKQLVVDSDKKGATIVSTIVLVDGVERVGKTGVAVEISNNGDRTGIIYMLQMKTEQAATGLFEQLLIGSDRTGR
ncbi:hypothetical protein JCM10213v2_004736 [Rhodosporidiobolus nylandii]